MAKKLPDDFNPENPLPNQKHEFFAINIARGMTIKAAYIEAGFKESPAASASASATMRRNPAIQARANFLDGKVRKMMAVDIVEIPETSEGITEGWLMMKQAEVLDKAIKGRNLSAANAAINNMMKVKGMFNKNDTVDVNISIEDKLDKLTALNDVVKTLPRKNKKVVDAEFEEVDDE